MTGPGDETRFPIGETDLWLFAEGNHRRLWEVLGSHPARVGGRDGVHFAVWAPNARRVSVVGDFCGWDGHEVPMEPRGASGVWARFVPGLGPGTLYKYEVLGWDGTLQLKTDPFGVSTEPFPGHASRVVAEGAYAWGDAAWMAARPGRDWAREPLAIYELHLGSWQHVPGEEAASVGYRHLAPRLVEHMQRFGFNAVQLMPVMEHPFGGSWGYQVTGYYAPTSRYGAPDDFRFFVDTLHRAGIAVLLDWVPAHFPRDAHGLAYFDGTHLYEHADPRQGTHPDWNTLIFNYGRPQVRNFLLANALYWLGEFHADGLRVDAVSSMLYLDYSRDEGQWVPNQYGGRENIDAIELLRATNAVVEQECPGALMIAEESTAWPGVTRPAGQGGLGFSFKWNMGWMHDTLAYFALDPVHRKANHDRITFAMLYEYSERYIMPLSHDEFVHGKGSLLAKMPGDAWRRFANLRTLLAYQYTRPGKVLLFMGTEIAPDREWDHEQALQWHLGDDPRRADLQRYLAELGKLYLSTRCLWSGDIDPLGFQWIDCSDREQSVLCYLRWDSAPEPRGAARAAEPTVAPTGEPPCSGDAARPTEGVAVRPAPAARARKRSAGADRVAMPTARGAASGAGAEGGAGAKRDTRGTVSASAAGTAGATGPAARPSSDPYDTGPLAEHRIVVLNLTPVPRRNYRVGVPGRGRYDLILSSDEARFGGSGHEVVERALVEDEPQHGFPRSIVLTLPPLAALVMAPGS